MQGTDTKVLVRFVTQDDAAQASQVDKLIARTVKAGDKLFSHAVVFCELVWVLRSAYGYARDDIAPVLEAFLDTPEFVVEDADLARRAVAEYSAGGADMADYFIGRRNERSGCDTTFTFDGNLKGNALFRLL